MPKTDQTRRIVLTCQAPSIIETNEILGSVGGEVCRSYENSTINFLDRWLPDDEGNPKGTYYSKEPFVNLIHRWSSTDIVYAQQHVNFKTEMPREKALKMVKTFEGEDGRVVGNVVKGWVTIDGHPRLMMHLNICDPVVNQHHKTGKLSLSSAFDCLTNTKGVIVDDINPDHILVFVEDPDNDAVPRDTGALLNMTTPKKNSCGCPKKYPSTSSMEEKPTMTEKKNVGRVLSGDNLSFLSEAHGKLKDIMESLGGMIEKASPKIKEETKDNGEVPLEVPDVSIKNEDGIRRAYVEGLDDETIKKMVDQLEGLDLSMVPEPLTKLLKTAQDEYATRKNKKNKEETMPPEMTPEEKKKWEEEEAKKKQSQAPHEDAAEDAAMMKKMEDQQNNLASIQTQLKNQQLVIDEYKRKEAINQERNVRESFETKFLANIKPAYRDTPEKISALYTEYKTNPTSLLNRMPEMHINANAETKREGLENVPDHAVSLVNSAPVSPDHFTAGTPDGTFGYNPDALRTYAKNIQNLSKAPQVR